MADNDQNNDEYKFAELDSLDNDSLDNPEYGTSTSTPGPREMEPKKNIKRNALIAVGLIVFVMLMYKFIGGMLSGKTDTVTPKETPVAEISSPPVTQAVPAEIPSEPIQPVQQPVVQEDHSALQQKMTSIESTQQTVQSEVTSMNQQIGSVNSNVNALSTQITKLNQMISDLTTQVAKQSEEINVLMDRTKPKPIRRVLPPQPVSQQTIYYINAVIPGRAWLIGSNGSTLTVREGTKIAGYGVVKLIDSLEGRILTSSGRTIRFSQEDS